MKNTLTLCILCCGILFSFGGSKKATQFDDSLYEDESLSISDTITDISTDSQNEKLAKESKLTYENAIYKPSIHSVQLHPLRFEMGNPLIHLSFKDSLLLSFDDLANEPQSYVHYQTVIPSSNMRPTLSGNYLLIVFPENNKDNPILSKRMMIMDEKISVKGSVKRATDLEQRNYQHEIDFSIFHSGYEIDDPFGDIKPVITQNSRWDNAIYGLQAVFIKDEEIVYDDEEDNLFDGGNEYRFFDIQSLRYLSERLADISFEADTHKVTLRTDEARRFQRYSGLVQDINGKRLIRVQEGSRNAIEADYAFVRFTLP